MENYLNAPKLYAYSLKTLASLITDGFCLPFLIALRYV
jgi:hypothetical protein